MNKNYDFFMKADLSAYIGEWVAIADNQVLANGKNVKQVYNEALKKSPESKPLLARVPNKEKMIL